MSGNVEHRASLGNATKRPAGNWVLWLLVTVAAVAAWWLVYSNLERFASWLVFGALGMSATTRLASAIAFFVYEGPKVLMLLLVVVFGVGIIRSFFTPERTRRLLAGRREALGNVLVLRPVEFVP